MKWNSSFFIFNAFKTYSFYGSVTKNKERIQKYKQDLRHIYEKGLDKACLHYGKTHENFKDLHKRAASNNLLHSKAFKIAKNAKYEWISMHNCFIGL